MSKAVKLANERKFSDMEEQGLIQAYKFTHELAWKMLKDFLTDKGNKEIYGSKGAVRAAFQYNLLVNGKKWMDVIRDRNRTSHTYNDNVAEEIVIDILNNYYREFDKLSAKMSTFINRD